MPVLHPIKSSTDPWLAPAEALYQRTFDRRERRDSLGGQLSNPRHHLLAILWSGDFAGFMTVWRFDAFAFIEHLATHPTVRGSGIGGIVLATVVQNAPLTVLEAERAEDSPLASRRLAWYQSCGFMMNPQAYRQPAYGPGLPEVPLHLLSHPRALRTDEFDAVVQTLRREVYAIH